MSRTKKDVGHRDYRGRNNNISKRTKQEAKKSKRKLKRDKRYEEITDGRSLKYLSADRWNHD